MDQFSRWGNCGCYATFLDYGKEQVAGHRVELHAGGQKVTQCPISWRYKSAARKTSA